MKKRTFIIMMIVVLIMNMYHQTDVAVMADEQEADVHVSLVFDKTVLRPGDDVTVRVVAEHFNSLQMNDGKPVITGIQMEIPIDTNIFTVKGLVDEAQENDPAPVFKASEKTANYDEARKTIKCVGQSAEGFMSEEDTSLVLMKFQLTVNEDLTENVATKIIFSKNIFRNMYYQNNTGVQYRCAVSDNALTITVKQHEIIYGDINGDETADIADALMISRYDAGLTELNDAQKQAGDVNNDETVDIADALMISRYDAGLIEELRSR